MASGEKVSTSAAKVASKQPKQTKRKLLNDSDSDSDGGAAVQDSGFTVNQEYARKFEHNKKREDKHRLEEKQKKAPARRGDDDDDDDDDSSSSDETEDEDGFLATEELDQQMSATLNAIRSRDPRVYDKNIVFYDTPEDVADQSGKEKKEKPVYLRDYHREKLLRGDMGGSDDEEGAAPQTYAEKQDELKKSFIDAIEPVEDEEGSDDDGDDFGFMKRKEPAKVSSNGVHPSRASTMRAPKLDVANASKNPETYLSNFLSARAWVPSDGSKWEAFESDDGEDDDRAEQFEQAYNLRFENPEKSNEVLKSYARDIAAARSVRREEKSARQRQRDIEREQKEERKREKKEEKMRLRKLKLDETEKKLRKVKQAAGATGKTLTDEEWLAFLDEAWENDKWEDEMRKRFGDDYYALSDGLVSSDEGEDGGSGKKKKKKKNKPKKPKWDDDIDIKDLVPEFEDEDAKLAAAPSDSGAPDGAEEYADEEEEGDSRRSKKRKTGDHKRERIEKQKAARAERAKLEALVDSKLELTHHDLLRSKSSASTSGEAPTDADMDASASAASTQPSGFRYRETSPQSFGMTARDILLAPSDQALNDYAGLKKLATFRDVEKKRRDKKHLGKKARLRQWRRDVFGREFEREGPTYGFERIMEDEGEGAGAAEDEKRQRKQQRQRQEEESAAGVVGDVGERKKKRKRSKGSKVKVET